MVGSWSTRGAEQVDALAAGDLRVEVEVPGDLADDDELLRGDLAAGDAGDDRVGAVPLEVGEEVVVGVLERRPARRRGCGRWRAWRGSTRRRAGRSRSRPAPRAVGGRGPRRRSGGPGRGSGRRARPGRGRSARTASGRRPRRGARVRPAGPARRAGRTRRSPCRRGWPLQVAEGRGSRRRRRRRGPRGARSRTSRPARGIGAAGDRRAAGGPGPSDERARVLARAACAAAEVVEERGVGRRRRRRARRPRTRPSSSTSRRWYDPADRVLPDEAVGAGGRSCDVAHVGDVDARAA